MENKELLIEYLKTKEFNKAEVRFKNLHKATICLEVCYLGNGVLTINEKHKLKDLIIVDYRVLNFDKDNSVDDNIDILLDEYCIGNMSNKEFINDLNIVKDDSILITKKDADIFFKAILDDDLKPNDALIEATKRYKDKL